MKIMFFSKVILSLFALTLTTACQNQQLPAPQSAPKPLVSDTAITATTVPDTANIMPQPVRLEPAFAEHAFDRPIELGPYPGNRLFVAEQDGRIYLLDVASSALNMIADLRPQVSRSGNEEGLLSVALDPNFEQNQHLWLYYSVKDGPRRTRLARFTVSQDQIDVSSELIILEQPQPYSNHNGGSIRFGPDQMLYLGVGDGGSGGDPQGNGQNTETLLGTILRLDVRNATAENPYQIPDDNPFVNGGGQPEIWAYGLRNPWRMAFDSVNGQLWLGDVGQNAYEEIDIVEKGGNYGWNIMEGDRCFEPARNCDGSATIAPIVVYGRDGGCSVTGGIIYRGEAIPEISNAYLYSDFCTGTIWAIHADTPTTPVVIATDAGQVSSFGPGINGEVYVLRFNGPLLQIVSP